MGFLMVMDRYVRDHVGNERYTSDSIIYRLFLFFLPDRPLHNLIWFWSYSPGYALYLVLAT